MVCSVIVTGTVKNFRLSFLTQAFKFVETIETSLTASFLAVDKDPNFWVKSGLGLRRGGGGRNRVVSRGEIIFLQVSTKEPRKMDHTLPSAGERGEE